MGCEETGDTNEVLKQKGVHEKQKLRNNGLSSHCIQVYPMNVSNTKENSRGSVIQTSEHVNITGVFKLKTTKLSYRVCLDLEQKL